MWEREEVLFREPSKALALSWRGRGSFCSNRNLLPDCFDGRKVFLLGRLEQKPYTQRRELRRVCLGAVEGRGGGKNVTQENRQGKKG